MFLSLIISLSFVFISTKINQNLTFNKYLEDFFSKDNKINDLINSDTEGNIWDNEIIKNEINVLSISSWEFFSLTFTWNTLFTWSIKIDDWGPIYLEVISYSWSDSSLENLNLSSFIISDSLKHTFTGYLDTSYDKADLVIKNLWWVAIFLLDLNKDFIWTWSIKKYKITKDIWWKEVEKTIIE